MRDIPTTSPSIFALQSQAMGETFVRDSFHNSVLKTAKEREDTFILNEFSLRNGEHRADIAVLNGKLIGYEIKTERDTLYRLPSQVCAYNEVFDKIYIVTAPKHVDGVLSIVPDWWGIYTIEQKADKVRFKLHRSALRNPAKSSLGIAQLLWKSEASEILATMYEYPLKSRTTKEDLNFALSELSHPKHLGKIALQYLKSRQGWRTNQTQLS